METNNIYHSLSDLRLRKEMLRNDILKDDQKIKILWDNLFHKNYNVNKDASPSKRFSGLINVGAGVLDGAILGWKLYRKFKRK